MTESTSKNTMHNACSGSSGWSSEQADTSSADIRSIPPDSLTGMIFAMEGMEHTIVLLNGPMGCKFYHSTTSQFLTIRPLLYLPSTEDGKKVPPETLTGSRWGQEACLPGHRWGTQGLLSPGRGMTPRRAAYTLHVADMRLEMHRQLFSLAGPCESGE